MVDTEALSPLALSRFTSADVGSSLCSTVPAELSSSSSRSRFGLGAAPAALTVTAPEQVPSRKVSVSVAEVITARLGSPGAAVPTVPPASSAITGAPPAAMMLRSFWVWLALAYSPLLHCTTGFW